MLLKDLNATCLRHRDCFIDHNITESFEHGSKTVIFNIKSYNDLFIQVQKCKTENWNDGLKKNGLKSSSLVFVYAGYPWQVIFVLPPYRPLNANLFVSIQDVLPQCWSVPFTKLIELENKVVFLYHIKAHANSVHGSYFIQVKEQEQKCENTQFRLKNKILPFPVSGNISLFIQLFC